MLKIFKRYPRLIVYLILTACFAGLGQTYVIAFFVPYVRDELHLTRSAVGFVYSLATLLGAFVLPYLGRTLDRAPVLKFTILSGLLLVVGLVGLSLSTNVVALSFSLLAVRIAGQGALTLSCKTTAVKSFGQFRGKALSMTAIGHLIAEASFPLLVTFMAKSYGWREAAIFLAALVTFFYLPVSIFALKGSLKEEARFLPGKRAQREWKKRQEKEGGEVSKWAILKDLQFWFVMIPAMFIPFFGTGIFYHQGTVTSMKGWAETALATSFAGYGLMRLGTAFFIGPVIDRMTAKRLYPIHVIPFCMGLLALKVFEHEIGALIFLLFMGMAIGLAGNILMAFWAEVYGPHVLGAMHGMNSTFNVISASLAPYAFGLFFDHGVTLDTIVYAGLIAGAIAFFCGRVDFSQNVVRGIVLKFKSS